MEENRHLDLSIIMIVYNEESNLERCLTSLPPNAELIVVDSNSSDRTVEIARRFNADVYSKSFTNYAEQKNYALGKAKKSWVLSIDADERCSEELKGWLSSHCLKNRHKDQELQPGLYQLTRRLVFMGRKMKFGGCNDYPLRLFPNHKNITFIGSIHESLAPKNLPIKRAPGYLDHFSYQNWEDYLSKLNRYTSLIAKKKFNPKSPKFSAIPFFSMRPWFEFFRRYILKLGFLDGYPGYSYALLSSIYAFMKYAKQRELYDVYSKQK